MYKRFKARGVSYTVNREYDSKLMIGASIDLSDESVCLGDPNMPARSLTPLQDIMAIAGMEGVLVRCSIPPCFPFADQIAICPNTDYDARRIR